MAAEGGAAGRPGKAAASAPLGDQRLLAIGGLSCLVALSIGLRLIPIIVSPCLNWADEIFQAIEPAHRLVYGYGLVPWEFQLGMRSWLLPGTVAGVMELTRIVGDGPDYYLTAIAVALGLLASAPVVCCFLWCRRWFGIVAGFAAALAVAVAPELVYFGSRALTEVVAAHVLVIALYLLDPGELVNSRRRLVLAGFLLGMVCLLRLQIAPAVGVIFLWSIWGSGRRLLLVLIGGGLAAFIFGVALDWLTLGYPLASIWRNLLYNLFYGVSSEISVDPPLYYLLGELGVWLNALPFLALLVVVGAQRMPILLAAAVMVVAVHSGIAHKEYRFIYPAILLVMILAAVGLAELVYRADQWLRRRAARKGMAAACAVVFSVCWCFLAFVVWSGGALAGLRQRDHDELLAISFVRAMPEPCGIGLYGDEAWVRYGGYTYLHRPVPMFWSNDATELASSAAAFDTVLYQNQTAPPPQLGFAPVQCFGDICVAHRPGGCEARAMPRLWFPEHLSGLAPPKERFAPIPQSIRPNAAARRQQ